MKSKTVSEKKQKRNRKFIYLKELIAEAGEEKKQLYCMFLDIGKAYDTINKQIMWELVKRLGFDEHK